MLAFEVNGTLKKPLVKIRNSVISFVFMTGMHHDRWESNQQFIYIVTGLE